METWMLWSIVGIIAAVSLILVGVIIWQLSNLLKAIKLLDSAVVSKLVRAVRAELSQGLAPLGEATQALQEHTSESFRELSDSTQQSSQQLQIAARVLTTSAAEMQQSGSNVGSAAQELQQTQKDLQRLLTVIAAPGTVQDWVGSLGQAVQPLKEVSDGISQHYQTNDELLRLTTSLLHQWGAQGETVAESAAQIARQLDLWTSRQEISRSDHENELRQMLQQANRDIADLRSNYASLTGSLAKLVEQVNVMSSSANSMIDSVKGIADTQSRTQQQQQQLVEGIGSLASSLQREQAARNPALKEMAADAKAVSESMLLMREMTKWMSEDLRQSSQETNSANQRMLHDLRDLVERQAQTQSEAASRIESAIDSMPSRSLQQRQLWVNIIFCVIILGLLVFLMRSNGG